MSLEIRNEIYRILEAQPTGTSLRTLSIWLEVGEAVIKNSLKIMQSEKVVERAVQGDKIVYRLIDRRLH
jgi:hypothetical protein